MTSSTRILVIQLCPTDPPARLGEWLADTGVDVRITHAYREPVDTTGFDGVICLGGAASANDVIGHPWLVDVRKALAYCVSANTPLLAICLGAQVLATALGGEVTVGEHGPEIGPGLIAKRDLAWSDPLFADLPLMPDVIQYHDDVVSRLPVGAELLASSTKYPHQAFRVGRTAYAVQFHIETTPEVVRAWADEDPEGAATVRPSELSAERLAEVHADVEDVWRPFVERFVRLVRGEFLPNARPLPLI